MEMDVGRALGRGRTRTFGLGGDWRSYGRRPFAPALPLHEQGAAAEHQRCGEDQGRDKRREIGAESAHRTGDRVGADAMLMLRVAVMMMRRAERKRRVHI